MISKISLILLLTFSTLNNTVSEKGWVTFILPDIENEPLGENNRASFLEFYYELVSDNKAEYLAELTEYKYQIITQNEMNKEFGEILINKIETGVKITTIFNWNGKEPKKYYNISKSELQFFQKNEKNERLYVYEKNYLKVLYNSHTDFYHLLYIPVKTTPGKMGFLYFENAEISPFKITTYKRKN